jgi:hypothetical protein
MLQVSARSHCSPILQPTSINRVKHTKMRFATLSLFTALWTMILAEPPVIEGVYALPDSPRGSYDQICGIPGMSSREEICRKGLTRQASAMPTLRTAKNF